jgi:hypothetical protein
MKTSELIGPALNWAVHTAQGLSEEEFVVMDNLYGPQWQGPEYSTSWQEGGPIIERERMEFDFDEDEQVFRAYDGVHAGVGPTHLIAAMRCYVMSRLGDEVDIPEELV